MTERSGLLTEVQEVGFRDREPLTLWRRLSDPNKFLRLGKGKWPQNDCVEDAEYHGCGTYAEAQRGDDQ